MRLGIPDLVVTEQGLALLAKTPVGADLPVTRWQIGSGVLGSDQPLRTQTELLRPVKEVPVAEVTNQGNQALVTGQFVNTDMEAFSWEELGLFAQDPDEGEILYAYGNARGNGAPMEAGTERYREAIFGVELVFDTAEQVTVVVNQSLVFIPLAQKGQPGGVPTLDDGGKIPEGQLPALNYDPAGSAEAVQDNLGEHAGDKNNPHGVTAVQAGALPLSGGTMTGNVNMNNKRIYNLPAPSANNDPLRRIDGVSASTASALGIPAGSLPDAAFAKLKTLVDEAESNAVAQTDALENRLKWVKIGSATINQSGNTSATFNYFFDITITKNIPDLTDILVEGTLNVSGTFSNYFYLKFLGEETGSTSYGSQTVCRLSNGLTKATGYFHVMIQYFAPQSGVYFSPSNSSSGYVGLFKFKEVAKTLHFKVEHNVISGSNSFTVTGTVNVYGKELIK